MANLAMVVALATGIAGNWSSAQLHADPVYLGPALTFALVGFILPLALAVEISHRTGATQPAQELPPGRSARA